MKNKKKIIFIGQGSIGRICYEIINRLYNSEKIQEAGLYVSSCSEFHDIKNIYPEIEGKKYLKILKEWEITSLKNKIKNNECLLDKYEKEIGDPTLWNAVFLDRRLIYGYKTKIKQEYKPRFNHDQIKNIIAQGCKKIEEFINQIKPDIIITFVPATFGSYLFYLISKKHNIKFYQIKSTKILNYLILSQNITEEYEETINLFNNPKKIKKTNIKKAKEYLDLIKTGFEGYEGVTSKQINIYKIKKIKSFIKRLVRNSTKKEIREDNYNKPGIFINNLYLYLINPIKEKLNLFYYKNKYHSLDQLKEIKYVYFPLHTEPEIALNLYARPYTNQIEVIRNIAYNLPINYKLCIKEHPRSLGIRSLKYYKKILEIPNVIFANPKIKSRDIINYSDLVIVISGFSGFEAILKNKPVITLGNCNFNLISSVKKLKSLYVLGDLIKKQLKNKNPHSKNEIVKFIASIIQTSFRVDIYSKMIKIQIESKNNIKYLESEDFNNLYNNISNKLK